MMLEKSAWSVKNGKSSAIRENECAQSISYIFLMYKSNFWPDGSTGRKVRGRQKEITLNGPWQSIANFLESSAKILSPRIKVLDGRTDRWNNITILRPYHQQSKECFTNITAAYHQLTNWMWIVRALILKEDYAEDSSYTIIAQNTIRTTISVDDRERSAPSGSFFPLYPQH